MRVITPGLAAMHPFELTGGGGISASICSERASFRNMGHGRHGRPGRGRLRPGLGWVALEPSYGMDVWAIGVEGGTSEGNHLGAERTRGRAGEAPVSRMLDSMDDGSLAVMSIRCTLWIDCSL